MIDQKELGRKLQEAREDVDLSQNDVAKEIEELNRSSISKIENGNQKVDSITLRSLSHLYGVSVDDLLSDTDQKQSTNFVKALRRGSNDVNKQEIRKIEDFCESFQFLANQIED